MEASLSRLVIMMTNRPIVSRENKTIDEIYLQAGALDKLFTENTPVALFRYVENGGNERMIMRPVLEEYRLPSGTTRSADVEREKINGEWYVLPRKRKGLSLSGGPAKFSRPGRHHVIPKGTTIPSGLAISDDGLSKYTGYNHYSVVPRIMMNELHYLFLLRCFAAHAIPYQG